MLAGRSPHLLHLFLGRVVGKEVARFDQALCQVKELLEIIAGVGDLVDFCAQPLDIFNDAVHKNILLLQQLGSLVRVRVSYNNPSLPSLQVSLSQLLQGCESPSQMQGTENLTGYSGP